VLLLYNNGRDTLGLCDPPRQDHCAVATMAYIIARPLHVSLCEAKRPVVGLTGLRNVLRLPAQGKSVDGLCIWLLGFHTRVKGRQG